MDKRRREIRILPSRLMKGTETRNREAKPHPPAFDPFRVPSNRDAEQPQQRSHNVLSVPRRVD
jgi:hypothetical protein